MILKLIFLLLFFAYPFWLIVKLARYGKGILRPNFERMQRKVNESTGFYQYEFFAWNRPGGKMMYYVLLFYDSLVFIIFFFLFVGSAI